MSKILAACAVIVSGLSYADNPLAGFKTPELFRIIRAQAEQGHCSKTPAIEEAHRRLFDDEYTAGEEADFLSLGVMLADCNINKEKQQAKK